MNNEITVKLNTTIQEFCKTLESRGFDISQKYLLDDIYFVPINLELEKMTCREILSQAILVRQVNDFLTNERIVKFTIKDKEIDNEGHISIQNKIECGISNAEEGIKFLERLGYHSILRIKEQDISYKKDNFELTVKDVENGDNLMEVETVSNNLELDTIDKVIAKVKALTLPIDSNNYFVKKAEIELEKALRKR